jgi:hypothetical protein
VTNETRDLYLALANSEIERVRVTMLATKLTKALHNIGVQCLATSPQCDLPKTLVGAQLSESEQMLLTKLRANR